MVPTRDPAAGYMIAIDPSIASTGMAFFRGGQLVMVRRVRCAPENGPDDQPECNAARCLRMAQRCATFVLDGAFGGFDLRTVVMEWPQIYRPAKSKGDPNDLPGIAGVGMAFAGVMAIAMAARNQSLVVRSSKPAEWCGQLPKSMTGDAWESPRGRRVRSHLNESEIQVVGAQKAQHDALDAVGIGLFHLGRFSPRRAYPGAV